MVSQKFASHRECRGAGACKATVLLQRPSRGRHALSRLSLLISLLYGCEQGDPPPSPNAPLTESDSVSAPPTPDQGELVFDREFLFLSTEADSLIIVPWFFRSRVTAEGIHREQTTWLSRGGDWEVLAQQTEDTPPTRSPWRILPGETVRLIVGPQDRIESLLFRDPPRALETVLGDLMTEWTSPGAQSVRMYRGQSVFPAGPVEGIVIEISRRWEATEEGGPGDWVFLHAGSGLQLFMQGERAADDLGMPIRYEGWTRVSLRDLQWSDLAMDWEELRAYEDARRDVPVRWSLGTPGEEVSGTLESVSSHLMTGQGDGPILPLLGLFEVSGMVEVQGEQFPVTGLIRHVQR